MQRKLNIRYIGLLLTFALGAAALVSCEKDPEGGDDVWNPLKGDSPVRIAARLGGLQETKATATAFENGDEIGVFGYYHNGSESADGAWNAASSIPNYMYNQLMTLTPPVAPATDPAWEYSPLKYWPNENGSGSAHKDKLSFWGYYPYEDGDNDTGIAFRNSGLASAYTNTSAGLPDVHFTAVGGMVDLMTSAPVYNVYKNDASGHGNLTDGEVQLDFRHRLSQITLKGKKVDDGSSEVKIHRLELRSVVNAGTFNHVTWTPDATETIYTYVNSDSGISLIASDDPAAPTPLGSLFLLPQTLVDGGQKLYVEYSVDDDPDHVEEIVDLYDIDTAPWAMNQHRGYTLAITPGGVTLLQLTLEILPWEYHTQTLSGAITPHIAWSGTRLNVDKGNGYVKLDNWAHAGCEFSFGSGTQWRATLVGDGDFTFCAEDGTSPATPELTASGTLSYNPDGSAIPARVYVRANDHTTLQTHEALLRFYLKTQDGSWQIVRMTTEAEGWGTDVYECKLIQNYK